MKQQAPDITESLALLLAQEEDTQLLSFTNSDALTLGLGIMAISLDHFGRGVAIHIERNRSSIFQHRMDDVPQYNADWCVQKKNTVDLVEHSSLYVKQLYIAKGSTFGASGSVDLATHKAVGGAFPVFVGGAMVGTVAVSGLTEEEDHDLCILALNELKNSQAATFEDEELPAE